jgi:phospholipid-binding lipoprotein MlaA
VILESPTSGHRGCLAALLISALLAGCAADPGANALDPFESTNRRIYAFNEKVDENLVRPVAVGYQTHVPQPVQTGVGNFFGNLSDIWSTLNNALQAKPKETVETGVRAAINTVFGILGVFDVATMAGIERHSADFGQTLGVWGVPSGPYVVLPLLGPSTARDTVGWTFDNYYNLWNGVEPISARYTGTAVKVVSSRAKYLGMDNSLNEVALDKYSFMRDAYLQRRSRDTWRRNRPADMQDSDGSDGSDGGDGSDGDYGSDLPADTSPAELKPVEASSDNMPEVLQGPSVTFMPDSDEAMDSP